MNVYLHKLVENFLTSPVVSEPLGALGESRNIAVSGTSASRVLSPSCKRISLVAEGGNCKIRVGVNPGPAVATDHIILAGERVDLKVPEGSTVSAIIAAPAVSGTLNISELI